ncbi:MAG: hypothetical protein QW756_04255 [Nitrososphaerota archaeon]
MWLEENGISTHVSSHLMSGRTLPSHPLLLLDVGRRRGNAGGGACSEVPKMRAG